jgi:hypothetical protein
VTTNDVMNQLIRKRTGAYERERQREEIAAPSALAEASFATPRHYDVAGTSSRAPNIAAGPPVDPEPSNPVEIMREMRFAGIRGTLRW